jgi:hypothetical protein
MKLLLTVRGVMGSTVVRTSSKSEALRKTDGPCLYKNQKGKAEHGPVIVAFTSVLDAKPIRHSTMSSQVGPSLFWPIHR